jgi:hypothetical protein
MQFLPALSLFGSFAIDAILVGAVTMHLQSTCVNSVVEIGDLLPLLLLERTNPISLPMFLNHLMPQQFRPNRMLKRNLHSSLVIVAELDSSAYSF